MKLPLVLCLCAAPALLAQPVPKLNSVSAEYLQRGTTPELQFRGENLASATGFLITGGTGVTAALVSGAKAPLAVESPNGGVSSLELKSEKSVKAKITIAPDAPLSPREVRIVTPTGVSNPLTLNIGYLREIQANGDNRSREKAQMAELPAAISGVISDSAQSHFYKFHAHKGEHVVLEVDAFRLGSPLDSSLAVLDKDGKELIRNEDARGLDSLVDFEAPDEADYYAELRDYRFQGGGNFRYRLLAGAIPHVDSVFPLGGQRGQNVEVSVKGQNLGSVEQVLLSLDPKGPVGPQDLRISTPNGISNPFSFDVSDLTERLEQEPNNVPDQSDRFTVPMVANGRIGKSGDIDAYRFRAEKGQKIVFEALANRFGSSLDPLLTLRDRSGNVLARNDDSSGSDARLEFNFTAADDYFLFVEDLLTRGGSDFAYRLSARFPRPSFAVNVLPDTPRVHRGGHVPLRCEVARNTGFGDTVRVECEDLPPGVYAEPLLLLPNAPASGYLMIHATRDAALGPLPLKIVASGLIEGKLVKRSAQISSGDKSVKAGYLTVLEASPFDLQTATLLATVEQDQTTKLDVVVQRKGDWNGEVRLVAEGFSAGREPLSKNFEGGSATVKPSEVMASLSLKPKLDSEIGARMVIIKGEATIDGQTVTEYSQPIPVATAQVPFVLSTTLKRLSVTALPPGSGSAASEAVFSVKVERRAGFNGEIALKLEGLPEGISANTEMIPANGGEAAIKLTATDKAPAGKEFPLTISGTGLFNDRTFRQEPQKVTLTISAPQAADSKPVETRTGDAKNVGAK